MRLDSARAKIGHAEQHLETFARMERNLLQQIGSPAEYSVAFDGSTTYRRRALPQPSVEFSLVAGDCLQNARSALEHAVFAYSKATEPSFDRTGFPICLTREEFVKQAKSVQYVPAAHRAFIASVQPFKLMPATPERSIIWLMHDLARIDRHRIIPTLLAVARAESVRRVVRPGSPGPKPEIAFLGDGGVEPGDPLLVLPPTDEDTISFVPDWDLYVSFAESGDWIEPLLRPMVMITRAMIVEMESDTPTWPPRTETSSVQEQ